MEVLVKELEINVVCAADNNFAQPLTAMIASLFYNINDNNVINLSILDGGIDDGGKQKILNLLSEEKNRRHTISFIKIDNEKYKGFKTSKNIPIASYYRIDTPNILLDFDRCVYLDADTIIAADISEIYFMDFEDNYVCAVEDSYLDLIKYYKEILNVPYTIGYFNVGVMVMNLKKMRENKIPEKIFTYLISSSYFIRSFDQDAINVILYDKWKKLDIEWNNSFIVNYYKKTPYDKEYFEQRKKIVKIVHFFCDFNKPWKYECVNPKRKLYFKYLDMTDYCGLRPKMPNIFQFVLKVLNILKGYMIRNVIVPILNLM